MHHSVFWGPCLSRTGVRWRCSTDRVGNPGNAGAGGVFRDHHGDSGSGSLLLYLYDLCLVLLSSAYKKDLQELTLSSMHVQCVWTDNNFTWVKSHVGSEKISWTKSEVKRKERKYSIFQGF